MTVTNALKQLKRDVITRIVGQDDYKVRWTYKTLKPRTLILLALLPISQAIILSLKQGH